MEKRVLLMVVALVFVSLVGIGLFLLKHPTREGSMDGLAYIYMEGKGNHRNDAILFLHQLNGRKEDWKDLMKKLNDLNFTVMAIDLRGHGESWGDWRQFSDEDFIAMREDVEKAVSFLESNGKNLYGVVGASIGANLALNTDAPKVVALSPGLDYRGIKARKRPAMIIVGRYDEYSYNSSIKLGYPAVYECACHGTELVPYAEPIIIDYLTGKIE